ncbi:hypothetical protein NUW58_g8907 [Xylaria curta]|uniref:Uncharacterized protein n=1 Tax=Xylaria curta TaxID=42375 RepID=A0ACC1N2T8_9PEZI|nr:hypothetical protein NUW58_g8907 [Xylaria curta]
MEIKARPPITPPATATVVWVLTAFTVVLFWAPFVKPGPEFADSITDPDVVAVAVPPALTSDAELDAAKDVPDVVVGADSLLVWTEDPRSCSVCEDGAGVGSRVGVAEGVVEVSVPGARIFDRGLEEDAEGVTSGGPSGGIEGGSEEGIEAGIEVIPVGLALDVSITGAIGSSSRSGAEADSRLGIDVEDVKNVVEMDVDAKVDVVEVAGDKLDDVVDIATRPPPTLLAFGTAVHFLPSMFVIENADIVA